MSMRTVLGLSKGIQTPMQLRPAAVGLRAFHTAPRTSIDTSKPRSFVPPYRYPGGSYIKGTVNDPTEYPKPNRLHGSYHWEYERVIAVSVIPLIATAFVKHGASGILDGVLSLVLLLHSHNGYHAILEDYLPVRKFAIAGPFAKWFFRFATIFAGVGLYEFNTNDIGLTELIARLWKA